MNDSSGWTSPGSDPSDSSRPGEDTTRPPSADAPPPSGQPTTWSARQPPATGQTWGAPSGPRPPGGPGWGGGPSAWNRPPAAKPGVIPLRPLGVGEILDGAVSTMRAHWRTVLGISLVVAVVTQGLGTAVLGVWVQDMTGIEEFENDPDPTFDEFVDAMGGLLGGTAVAVVITLLGTIVATAMLTMVVSRAVLGRSVSVGESWRDSRPRLLRLCGLLLLLPLIVTVVVLVAVVPGIVLSAAGAGAAGAVLVVLGALAAVVAGIWLWILFSLAPPALMLEKQGVIAAMRRSAKLVRGSWWRIFGVLLLTQVLVFIVAGIIQVPADVIGQIASGRELSNVLSTDVPTGWTYLVITGIGAVIASTITLPIGAGVTALLYLDQRIRREALDLELARAAGVPGFAPGRHDDAEPES